MHSRISRIVIGCTVVALLLVAIKVGHLAYRRAVIAQVTFDSSLWNSDDLGGCPTTRQMMIRDLVNRILPGRNRKEIESLLGGSLTEEEMQRCDGKYSASTQPVQEELGYYFDENGWDLLYPIGQECFFLFNHRGYVMDPDEEYLILRLDDTGTFESWYIAGSGDWPNAIGPPGKEKYREYR